MPRTPPPPPTDQPDHDREKPGPRGAFDGDFSTLPFRAGIDHGPVPMYPIDSDFQVAAQSVAHEDPFTMRGAAHRWQVEAIRWRRQNMGRPLDLAAIAQVTAKRLGEAQARELAS